MFSTKFIVKSHLSNIIRLQSKTALKVVPKDRFSPFGNVETMDRDFMTEEDFFDEEDSIFETASNMMLDDFHEENNIKNIENSIFSSLKQDLEFSKLFGRNFHVKSSESCYVESESETEMIQTIKLGNQNGKQCSCSSIIKLPENENVFDICSIHVKFEESGQEFHINQPLSNYSNPSSMEVVFSEK
eukprot:gene4414-7789_t